MDDLTPKQAQFVIEYLIDLNATQAAIRAGYSEDTAQQIGSENLLKPLIAKAIQEQKDARAARTLITADRVLQEIGKIAMCDPSTLGDNYGKLSDKIKALDLAAKHLGIYAPEKVDVNGSIGVRTLDDFYGEP